MLCGCSCEGCDCCRIIVVVGNAVYVIAIVVDEEVVVDVYDVGDDDVVRGCRKIRKTGATWNGSMNASLPLDTRLREQRGAYNHTIPCMISYSPWRSLLLLLGNVPRKPSAASVSMDS